MSQKIDKKIRREARKLYTGDVRKIAQSHAIDEALHNFVKPKPKFWPRWLYSFLLRKLLNVDKK